jgi:capsular polysaccharide biosynthesis protein
VEIFDSALTTTTQQVRITALLLSPLINDPHSRTEQICLFNRAIAVIGAHGAGMANILHTLPGTAVLELLPTHMAQFDVARIFWGIAKAIGARHKTLLIGHDLMVPNDVDKL